MLIDRKAYPMRDNFVRECMTGMIDHLQRRGLNEAEAKKLRRIYVGKVAGILAKGKVKS